MAKTHNRLSADVAESIVKSITMSNIRPLWFDKYGPKMDTLLSREDMLEAVGVEVEKLNVLEMRGVDAMLGLSIHQLKKFAQKRKYNWVEIQVHEEDRKRPIVYYGFTTSIDNIAANVTRFEKMKQSWMKTAKTAKQLAEIQKKELTA